MENLTYCIEGKDIVKRFKGFAVDIPELKIPKGFATALIGENGAGKTTLLNMMSGIRLDYQGEFKYFEQWTDKERETKDTPVKEKIGYCGTGLYFLPGWRITEAREMSKILFKTFDEKKFDQVLYNLGIASDEMGGSKKKISELSDGNKVKLMLAELMARDTDLWIMDEPASPLDPVMRDRLNDIIHEYIEAGNGERSVFFSTHNISDMENVTDYAIIMQKGQIAEKGFVEDLKEKYVLVKGESEDISKAKSVLYSMSSNKYGFEGICLAENLDQLAGMDVTTEVPTLFQISVAVMKQNSILKG